MSSRSRERRGGMGASNAPKTWAEDCNTYRTTRGTQALSTVDPDSTTKRFTRTTLAQFGDIRHPYLATGGSPHHKNVDEDYHRFERHGWGDTTLLKEGNEYPDRTKDVPFGRRKVGGAAGPGAGSNRPADASATDRSDLFGTLQQTDVGPPPGKDSWMGNRLTNPSLGKGAVASPQDPKGRRDLFDVLNSRNPGVPSDDSWMGHQHVDPQKGKALALTPAERMGRMNLNNIMEQSILHDEDRDHLLYKGADALGDSWLGNQLVDPKVGKAATLAPNEDAMVDSACNVGAHAEEKYTRHRALATGESKGNTVQVKDIINGVAPPEWTPREEWGSRTRRHVPIPQRTVAESMQATIKPRAAQDAGMPWQWDDSKVERRKVHIVKPGDGHPATGTEMLYWKPEEKLAQFVQYGNKAQVRNNFSNGRAKDPIIW